MSDLRRVTASGRIGWIIVLGVSILLTLYGGIWYLVGPDTALENIAERTALGADAFRQGSPSAFDVISIVARQGAAFMAGLGLATLLLAWHGLRAGSPIAWRAAWAMPAAVAAFGGGFTVVPGAIAQGAVYLGAAALAAVGLVLARRGIRS
jgi:hypothetical protein